MHPSECFNYELKDIISNQNIALSDNSKSLSEELENCWAAVSIFSSGLVEAIASHVIPVLVNTTCYKDYPFPIKKLGVGLECRSFDEAYSELLKLIKNQAYRTYYQENIDAKYDSIFSNKDDLRSILNT